MKKKHSFGFLCKYLFLAAALMAVLCFSFVFARFTTGATSSVTASIGSFDVESFVFENTIYENDQNGYSEKDHASGVIVGSDSDEYALVLVVVNKGTVPVSCSVEMGDGYMITEAVSYNGLVKLEDGVLSLIEHDDDGKEIYPSSDSDGWSSGDVVKGTSGKNGLTKLSFGDVAEWDGEQYEDGDKQGDTYEKLPFIALSFTIETYGEDNAETVSPVREDDSSVPETYEWNEMEDIDDVEKVYGWNDFKSGKGSVKGLDDDKYHGYWLTMNFTVHYDQAQQ